MSAAAFLNKPAPVQKLVRKLLAFEHVVTSFAVGSFF
jgi:hypothetical protein